MTDERTPEEIAAEHDDLVEFGQLVTLMRDTADDLEQNGQLTPDAVEQVETMGELVKTIKSEYYHTQDADREDGDMTDDDGSEGEAESGDTTRINDIVEQYAVGAVQGDSLLILDADTEERLRTGGEQTEMVPVVIYDGTQNEVFEPFPLQSILKQGYWEGPPDIPVEEMPDMRERMTEEQLFTLHSFMQQGLDELPDEEPDQ